MGASQLGCDSCQSKDDSTWPMGFLPSLNGANWSFPSLQNQFLGCHWVTSHGSQQWRHPGGEPRLLAQLWAPGQALSGWVAINQQREQEGRAQALPSLTACAAASGQISVLAWQPITGPKQRNTGHQIYLVLVSKIHGICQTGGNGDLHIPLSLKIKSKILRNQLSNRYIQDPVFNLG